MGEPIPGIGVDASDDDVFNAATGSQQAYDALYKRFIQVHQFGKIHPDYERITALMRRVQDSLGSGTKQYSASTAVAGKPTARKNALALALSRLRANYAARSASALAKPRSSGATRSSGTSDEKGQRTAGAQTRTTGKARTQIVNPGSGAKKFKRLSTVRTPSKFGKFQKSLKQRKLIRRQT